MRIAAALLALGLLAAADTPQPTYLDTLEVRITNLDVVVSNRKGAPVRGLTREDFEVRENGTLQPITNFAEYTASSGAVQALNFAVASEGRIEETVVSAPPPRKVLFFIDDMALHPLTRKKLLNDAIAFVDDTLQNGDEAMVVTPSTANKLSLSFTPDRAAVRARVHDLIGKSTWRADSPYDSERFFYERVVGKSMRPTERLEAKRVYAMRVVRRVNGTLRTLLGMVGSLADLPGRKVIVVISASITATPGLEAYTLEDALESGATNGEYDTSARGIFGDMGSGQGWKDMTPMIREIGATAAGGGITIYSLQPDMGVHVVPPGGFADTHRGTRAVGALALSQYQRDVAEGTRATLGTLADLTGGKFFQGGAQVDNAFRQLANDVSSYYSIAYRAPQGTNDAFRKIDVVVKGRPDLLVRTRRELLRPSPGHAMDQLVASTLYVPREVNELGISASAQKPQRELDHYKVNIDVKLPLDKLTFIPVGNVYRATFSLHYAAADGYDYATGATRQQSVEVAAAELEAVRQKTYTYTTTLVISPGTARIAVGVLDELSRLSSLQRLTVEAK